jgi:hypothetical protein
MFVCKYVSLFEFCADEISAFILELDIILFYFILYYNFYNAPQAWSIVLLERFKKANLEKKILNKIMRKETRQNRFTTRESSGAEEIK